MGGSLYIIVYLLLNDWCVYCGKWILSNRWPVPSSPVASNSGYLGLAAIFSIHPNFKDRSTCDSAHLWRLNSAASLEDHDTGTMTWYPPQSYNCLPEQINHCAILLMPSARLGRAMHQICKSLVWFCWDLNPNLPHWKPVLYVFGHK